MSTGLTFGTISVLFGLNHNVITQAQYIYYGNFVLGRIAVLRGDLVQAGQYLLAAGGTSGSPQLNSFGPNEALAKDLLDKGQPDVVLQYFTLCKSFWKMDLASWINGAP